MVTWYTDLPNLAQKPYGRAWSIHDNDTISARDEAVKIVLKYDGEFPQKYWKEFLDYLDITEKEFWYVADKFRSRHIWKPTGAKFAGYSPEAQYKLWKLKYLVDY